MFYTCNYNIGVTHRNGAIKHIFYESDPRRDHQQVFFIHFVAPCALHLAVKILLNLSVWRFEHVGLLHTSVGCISPPEYQQDRTLLHNTISENILIFDINHQQNTRRSDQIETIKTIMQTTRPRITWKVLPMAQVAIFKEIFDQVQI